MSEINFIDTTLRDAHQSLWATRMTTAMMLPIAPVIDRAGYKLIDLMGTVQFDACLRYLREDPWERIRLIHKAMPNTPLGAGFRSEGLTGFNIVPDSLVCLWIERLAANGISEVLIMESLHDWDNIAGYVKAGKAAGMTVKIPLVFCDSPVHTDEYYGKRTAHLMKQLKPDAVYIKDANGVTPPERVKTLVPAIQKHLKGLPLELHSHCTTGLAPVAYLEAIKLGVKTLHTAVPPLANGASQPSINNIMMNARRLGFTPRIDEQAVAAETAHFRHVARQEGKPEGAPVEYDLFQYQHQVPGGMISNLEFMLSERKLEHRLNEVLEEIARIRVDWGYPIMVTPFSQILGTQAMINVVSGERYSMAPRETIMYILELYGKSPAPIDPNVKDKILGLPEAKDMLKWTPPQPSIQELRKKFGRPEISDDEFLLRVLFAQEHVDATIAAGPTKTSYPTGDKPVMVLVDELMNRKSSSYIHVRKGDFSFTIQNNAS
jgi:oxaloacetate decarboxylase (Na+ extruding) subunit alpha